MKKVIIVGSSRKDGETKQLVHQLCTDAEWDVLDLLDYDIGHFDYEFQNQDDDFLHLIRTIIEQYEVLVFATPVYWYSMSGRMKVFFDRLTDLLIIEKELGRRFRNKHMAVISSSNGNNLGEEFWLPFKKTADYLGMRYIADLHTDPKALDLEELSSFVSKIDNIPE